jgi:CubicO group peptidase (beta-lactamase class C family)
MLKKLIRRILQFLGMLFLLTFLFYCWAYFPILTGYTAKATCSAVFVSGRNPADVKKQDFARFPFNLTSSRVDIGDSSVTSSIFGLAGRKAIYRKGLGATLLNGITEQQLRQQQPVLASPSDLSQDTMPWPQGDRLTDTPPVDVDTIKLRAAVEAAFFDSIHKEDWGTRAFVVVYKGRIVAERYAPGFTAQMPLLGWSMTKSIINALIGIMVAQKQLDIRAHPLIPAWQQDDRRNITWTNLMQMTSGQRFWWSPLMPSDLTNMLFKEKDMAAFAKQLPLKHSPGAVFHYSDGNAIILSRLIRDRLGDKEYYRFPYDRLFYKIGMQHTLLEPDASGSFVGSSYCYATARDWARFGLLYLHDGVWNGQRLLPEGWVRWTASPSGVHNNEDFTGEYGALWWINAIGRSDSPGWRNLPDVPADCFSCRGFDGQYIFVIPSKDLVVVRLSLERRFQDPNLMLYGLLKAFAK